MQELSHSFAPAQMCITSAMQDAATLFTIIRWLRAMAHQLSQTVLISLLQPPPETFNLFDDVMLMCEGVLVYHGPVASAVEHMCTFGFELPPRKVRQPPSPFPNPCCDVPPLGMRSMHGHARPRLAQQHLKRSDPGSMKLAGRVSTHHDVSKHQQMSRVGACRMCPASCKR